MTTGFSDRLGQLRSRWQADPSSRVFLQLAEEYRHLGRVKEALEALDAGLKEHPGYLSALVAKGRCHLELGEADRARAVLERVVQQDATQMVANKLLVRVYLEIGDAERARQRLDIYTLINDSDPEIDELDKRVAAMSRPPLAMDGPRPEEPAERARMDSSLPPTEGLHPSPTSPASQTPAAAETDDAEPLDLDSTLPSVRPVFARIEGPGVDAAAAAAPVVGTEPFPELSSPGLLARYLHALEGEGIFAVAASSRSLSPAEPPAEAVVDEPSGETVPPVTAPAAEEVAAAAAPARAAAEEEAASEPEDTATLGFLYLRQGHLAEAERIFRDVLRREPDNAGAGEALARIEKRRQPLDASRLLEGFEPGTAAGGRVKKAFLLNSYLRRLKAGPRHVS